MKKLLSLLAGAGTTGAGGGSAGAGNGDTGTAGAAGAGAAEAAAGAGAGAAAGAGASAAGGDKGGTAPGAGSFAAAAAGTDGNGKAGGEGTAGKGPAGPGEPYTLSVPEGVTDVDKPLLEGFTKFANESKLPKEAAQAVLDFYSKQIAERTKADVAAYEQRLKDQRKALETHPKIGGANLPKSQELARRAVLTLDKLEAGLGSEFTKELVDAGLGDSPVVARLLVLVGEQLAEDSVGASAGGGVGAAKKPLTKEQRLAQEFPSLAKELLGTAAQT